MPGYRRGTPAHQLARDYAVSLNDFAKAVIDVLIDSAPAEVGERGARQRREVCAAVSAAMMLALEASSLSEAERGKLESLIRTVLLPFWTHHCNGDPDAPEYITARIAHYSARKVPGSQVKSAVNIVGTLLDAMEIPETRRLTLTERLVPAFAHRLVGDIYRINDVRARHGIELSVIGTMCTMLHVTLTYDPILRVLKIG
jgi:hypothetical protein